MAVELTRLRAIAPALAMWALVVVGLGCRTAAADGGPATRLPEVTRTFPSGPLDAITDVAGVAVGHVTLVEGAAVRTGVTAIVPHHGNVFAAKLPAAIAVANGFGKLVGYTQVAELGQLETPILLTNTLATFDAASAVVEYTLEQPGNEDVHSVNPVVGETNDGWLNDIRRRSLRREHFRQAIDHAQRGRFEQGSVGAGTGTRALGFKGGIGTASRRVVAAAGAVTIGVLVQTNFGGTLTVGGTKVEPKTPRSPGTAKPGRGGEGGSCVIVVATDAALDARQLRRLARRAFVGMARTGATFSHGSGDYTIAFSTAGAPGSQPAPSIADDELTPLFIAVAEATEAAIVSSLKHAKTVTGHRGTATALLGT